VFNANGKLCVKLRLLLAIALTIAGMVGLPQPAYASSACQSYVSGQCTLPPDDASRIVISPIYDCPQYDFLGNPFGDKGRDGPIQINATGINESGQMTKGQSVSFSILLSEDCRAWTNAYSFDISLTSPSGKIYSTNLVESGRHRYENNTNVYAYCFLNICSLSSLTGNITLPNDSTAGKYVLSLHAVANSPIIENRGTVKYWSWGSVFSIAAAPGDPIGFPQVSLMSTENSGNGPETCFTFDLNSALVASSQVTGIHWLIRQTGLQDALDDFIYPLPPDVDKGGPAGDAMKNGNAFSTVQPSGAVAVGYVFRNTILANEYSCQMSFIGAQGEGAPVVTTFTSQIVTANFKLIPTVSIKKSKKTITCVSSKNRRLTKTISGLAPKCPPGYSPKK
jgi:hypothetical protein